MLSIAVASLSFDPPSQIAGAASVSVDPPSQIVLKDALFHVQNYFGGGLFAVGDRHMVSGTASLSGGDLTVMRLKVRLGRERSQWREEGEKRTASGKSAMIPAFFSSSAAKTFSAAIAMKLQEGGGGA